MVCSLQCAHIRMYVGPRLGPGTSGGSLEGFSIRLPGGPEVTIRNEEFFNSTTHLIHLKRSDQRMNQADFSNDTFGTHHSYLSKCCLYTKFLYSFGCYDM